MSTKKKKEAEEKELQNGAANEPEEEETEGEGEEGEELDAAREKVEDKVADKAGRALKKGVPKKTIKNIVGEIEPPNPEDKDDVKSYFKKLDEKIDKVVAALEKKSAASEDDGEGEAEDDGETIEGDNLPEARKERRTFLGLYWE